MIPVSLTIKGLYSYRSEQTIDFTRLMQSHVFGIFGKTGSGKSTILEAITFALYGEVERLNVTGDNRYYNMMNQKSNELLIDFTFQNHDDKLYRFVVKGKRNSKNYDDVPTFKRTAYIKNDSWEALETADATELLGLSYQNFKRTVIIPQGKFQEFMELGDAARTRMLKEIFNLDKYEFYEQAGTLAKQTNDEVKTLEGNLTRYDSVTAESIAEKETATKALVEQLESKRVELNSKQQQLDALQLLKQQFNDLEAKRKTLSELQTHEPAFIQLHTKLDGYDYCLKHFKHNFERRRELLGGIDVATKKLETLSHQAVDNEQKLEESTTEFAEVEKDHAQLDWLKEELNDIGHLIQLLSLRNEDVALETRIGKGVDVVQKQDEIVTRLRGEVETLDKDLEKQSKNLPDLVELTNAKHWYAQRESMEAELEKLQTQIKSTGAINFQTEYEFITKLVNRFREDVQFDKNPTLINIEPSLKSYRQQCISRIDELHVDLSNYQHTKKLSEYVETLEDGSPCPLCGSEHHPNILQVDEVEEVIDQTLTAINDQKILIESCDWALNELAKTKATMQSRVAQLDEQQKEFAIKKSALEKHRADFHWNEFSPNDKKHVEKAYNVANDQHKQVNIFRLKLSELRNDYDKATQQHEKFRNALVELQKQSASIVSKHQVHQQQLKRLKFDDNVDDADKLKLREAELKQSVAQTELRYKQLSSAINELKTQKQLLEERKLVTANELSQHKQSLQKVEREIEDCLSKSDYSTREEIEAVLAETIDMVKERKRVKEFSEQLFAATTDVKKLSDQLAGKSFDNALVETLTNETTLLKNLVQELNDNLVREKSALEKLKTDLVAKQALVVKLESLQQRAANLNTLLKLFKGSGFVNYISTKYLNNLCLEANKRFHKLVGNKYTLSLTDKNDFQICDHFNANKMRDVKTLSGGQKFQAALSLALALAENVQKLNQSEQNFFFLDEGFGSLDKESLSLVFDALKALRRDNRVVGVISHVEDLQQEIDSYLEVTNDSDIGSTIRNSWN